MLHKYRKGGRVVDENGEMSEGKARKWEGYLKSGEKRWDIRWICINRRRNRQAGTRADISRR